MIPCWNGQELPHRIPDNIYREVLHQLCKESFKRELLLADHVFYELKPVGFDDMETEQGKLGGYDMNLDASNRKDRDVKLHAWIPGLLSGGETGFESVDLATRQHSAYALFRVLLGWTRIPIFGLETEMKLHRLAPGNDVSELEVREGCFRVCRHYVVSYAEYFERAPIVPHTLATLPIPSTSAS